MSVVGIDFGSLNTVVAVARNRGIDVITNEVSNRATPSLVSFGEKQRYLGESAKTQEISNFKNTVASIKRLAGRPFSDPDVPYEKTFINSNLVEGERGEVAASVFYQNEERSFTFSQLCAMFLGQVKDFTSKEIGSPVTDVVISVPGWFTDRERRALLDAADVAGLNALRLMNDGTSAALGYGITKTDLPEAGAKPKIVVFFDCGWSSTQVSVVSFIKGKLIVKGTAFDRNLGGRDLDQVLVEHYAKEFTTKYKIDINSNAKARFRLRQGCEKVKKILSANAVTLLNVECIMDDKDVSAQVNRTDFEEWAAPLAQRFKKPLEDALAAAGVSPEEVDFVELVGGSTRVPAIKQVLSDMFGAEKLSTTLNQDEAVARGCALQCAMISPVFKVRDFAVQDWNGYPIELSWDASFAPPPKDGEQAETTMQAFPIGNSIPSTKLMTFYRVLKDEELASSNGSVSLDIEAQYSAQRQERNFPEGTGKWIGKWTLNGIKQVAGDSKGKAIIKVKTKLDTNGLVGIESATQIEEQVVSPEASKDAAKSEDGSPAPMDVDSKEAAGTPPTDTPPATPPAEASKTKIVSKRHNLTIVPTTAALSPELLNKWKDEEGQMQSSDRLVIDTAEARNALEEYVYDTRSKLEMAWTEFVDDATRATFLKELNEMEDWLYTEEGEAASKGIYSKKLAGLKKTGDPIKSRYLEFEERPRHEKQFRDYINSVLINASSGDERYAHLSKEDLEKVTKEAQQKLNWLNDSIAKLNEQPKSQPPVVTFQQINREREALYLTVTPILNKPKPAPKKEEEKKEEKKEEPKEAAKDEKKEEAERMDVD
ncbi:heat shock protein 70 family [Phlyctochytrium arcticum]|nr:heat shock protein 70 family [Phlyctochytrium arcticum]